MRNKIDYEIFIFYSLFRFLMQRNPFLGAIKTKDIRAVAKLCNVKQQFINSSCDSYGNTPLMIACLHNLPEIAKCIICEGKPNINLTNNGGKTALVMCYENEYHDILNFILQYKKFDPPLALPDVKINDIDEAYRNNVTIFTKLRLFGKINTDEVEQIAIHDNNVELIDILISNGHKFDKNCFDKINIDQIDLINKLIRNLKTYIGISTLVSNIIRCWHDVVPVINFLKTVYYIFTKDNLTVALDYEKWEVAKLIVKTVVKYDNFKRTNYSTGCSSKEIPYDLLKILLKNKLLNHNTVQYVMSDMKKIMLLMKYSNITYGTIENLCQCMNDGKLHLTRKLVNAMRDNFDRFYCFYSMLNTINKLKIITKIDNITDREKRILNGHFLGALANAATYTVELNDPDYILT